MKLLNEKSMNLRLGPLGPPVRKKIIMTKLQSCGNAWLCRYTAIHIRPLQVASRFLVPRPNNVSENVLHYTYIVCAHPDVACSPRRPFFSQRAIISQAMFLVFSLEAESVRNSADPRLFFTIFVSGIHCAIMT